MITDGPRELNGPAPPHKTQDSLAGASPPQVAMLVMQPTTLCNLDCSYCYLPDRHLSRHMSLDTVDAVFRDLSCSDLLGRRLTVVWHSGEPLVAGRAFFERAFETAERFSHGRCQLRHSIQTNGTLIDDAWCRLFSKFHAQIGVSIDGPASIHDRHRLTRGGRPTHARTVSGFRRLSAHGIGPHVICVLTHASLSQPAEIFEFFRSIEAPTVCFNVEEIDGVNLTSSLTRSDARQRYADFLDEFCDRASAIGMRVREIERLDAIAAAGATKHRNDQNTAFRIVSVAADGGFSTFSPELLPIKHARHGGFVFGNIHTSSLRSMLQSPKFREVDAEIQRGVRRCEATCDYFRVCGGGAPSNKLFENGTFDCTETMHCQLSKQTLAEVWLRRTERRLGIDSCAAHALHGESIVEELNAAT